MIRMNDESGVALIVTLMSMTLMAALGTMLVLLSITETRISANYGVSAEGLYAADAAMDLAIGELAAAPDWDIIFSGRAVSRFVDGAGGGTRMLPDGMPLDLTAATNIIRCGKASACSGAEMSEVVAQRPWGANNPYWQVYVSGRLDGVLAGGPRAYVIAWVGDDPSENDGDPLRDGRLADNPGRGVARILVHAYATGGIWRVLEATVERVRAPGRPRVRRLAWREVR